MSTRLAENRVSDHRGLLEEWLRAPHVVEWWGATSVEDVLDSVECESRRVIEEDGVPVGFLRWHRLTRQELDAAGLGDIPVGGYDLDLLVGSASHLGRGVGTRALLEAEAFLERSVAPPFLTLCTETRNARALACYRKAGFAVVRAFAEFGKDHFLLCKCFPPRSETALRPIRGRLNLPTAASVNAGEPLLRTNRLQVFRRPLAGGVI